MSFPILPDRASDYANHVDAIFYVLVALTVFFTGLVFVLLAYFSFRYRRGSNVDRSNPLDHSLVLELGWSITPLLMGLVIFVWAAIPYASAFRPPNNALEIFVIGKQWMWHLQHSNGVRENNELHIPLGQAIKVTVISQDVIHGFYIPAFRIKRDAMPGRYNTMWFTPTTIGKFHLFCTEYCGMGHSEMAGWVYVMKPADYQAWLASKGEAVAAAKQTMEQLGENLYTQFDCGSCHDKDGLGRGPILAGIYGTKVLLSNGTATVANIDYLRNSILNPSDDIAAGYQQVMPSYKGEVTEEQVLELIAYIKSLSPTVGGSAAATPSKSTPRSKKGTGNAGGTPIPVPAPANTQNPASSETPSPPAEAQPVHI